MRSGTILLILLIVLVLVPILSPYDDTDDRENRQRSGMYLFTDHGTGCQYLGRILGGLVPRLDQDGKQVCRAKAK